MDGGRWRVEKETTDREERENERDIEGRERTEG